MVLNPKSNCLIKRLRNACHIRTLLEMIQKAFTSRTNRSLESSNIKTGTLKWSWEDDNGCKHTFLIPDSYYVSEDKVRLLSPQHWAQSQSKSCKARTTCGERTNENECMLFWNNGHNKLHIDLNRENNVATFPMAHGYRHFAVFCSEAGLDPMTDDDLVAMPTSLISDDEDGHDEVAAPVPST